MVVLVAMEREKCGRHGGTTALRQPPTGSGSSGAALTHYVAIGLAMGLILSRSG
jgi:hypothetical protein